MAKACLRLAGKVAIVTGAGSRGLGIGNGKATAILFAREGAKVLLVDQFLERAQETLMSIDDAGGVASAFAADVTKADDCKAMVAAAVERYRRLDILHNNVGISSRGNVLDMEDWDPVMDVNLKSVTLTSKFAIPEMTKGGGGAIVNISSVGALRPRGHEAYTVSKAGVIALTQAMAWSHAKDHIRVNCIAPGNVYTPMVAGGMDEQARERRRLSVPLQTEGTAWDIAWAAVYLASDEARWVTGITLPVDGGILLTREKAW